MIEKKNKQKWFRTKTSRTIDNNSRFLRTIISSREVIKSVFFKRKTKQIKVTKFIVNLTKKNNYNIHKVSNFLMFILLQTHLFFFAKDANHFLKSKFIYVNNTQVSNRFFEVKINDTIKLVTFNSYFDYVSRVYKFFKKKRGKIKYKQ